MSPELWAAALSAHRLQLHLRITPRAFTQAATCGGSRPSAPGSLGARWAGGPVARWAFRAWTFLAPASNGNPPCRTTFFSNSVMASEVFKPTRRNTRRADFLSIGWTHTVMIAGLLMSQVYVAHLGCDLRKIDSPNRRTIRRRPRAASRPSFLHGVKQPSGTPADGGIDIAARPKPTLRRPGRWCATRSAPGTLPFSPPSK